MHLFNGRRRVAALAAGAALTAAAVALSLTGGPAAGADTRGTITFEDYSTGSLYGQQGWTGLEGGCGKHYDTGVVADTGAPAAFGTKSLRMSNAVTSGCFGDQLFSPKLTDEAGETRARATTAGGVRQPVFTAQWSVASVTKAAQPGLFTSISPDNGSGARMSYVSQFFQNGRLYFDFVDVKGLDPMVKPGSPYYPAANFRDHLIGPFNPAVPHTVTLRAYFRDGEHNDVVTVAVDGITRAVGTSWEDYYDLDKEAQGAGPSAVDCLIFRESGPAHPELTDKGFLFDNIRYASSRPGLSISLFGSGSASVSAP